MTTLPLSGKRHRDSVRICRTTVPLLYRKIRICRAAERVINTEISVVPEGNSVWPCYAIAPSARAPNARRRLTVRLPVV